MMVILTSFARRNDFVGNQFSVARWAPKGVSMPALDFLAATGVGEKELHLKDFQKPITEFAVAYRDGLKERWREVEMWLGELDPEIDIVLCCWCPRSKSADEWFAENGTIACHNLLLGKLIKRFRPDVEIVLDEDRNNFAQPEWKP